jgi:hypothetical protein
MDPTLVDDCSCDLDFCLVAGGRGPASLSTLRGLSSSVWAHHGALREQVRWRDPPSRARGVRCLTTLLTAMPLADAIDTTRIPRVAGLAGGHASCNGQYVELSISDAGWGIPAEYLGHLFDPFSTTKERERAGAIIFG